jgi:hypothetical protein
LARAFGNYTDSPVDVWRGCLYSTAIMSLMHLTYERTIFMD